MFATFADLAVSAVPVGAVVGQESPGFLLYVASWDLGVAAWGKGDAEVPHLAVVGHCPLRGGATWLPFVF